MKQEEFIRGDGTKGYNYKFEAGDVVISKYSKVGERASDIIVRAKKPTEKDKAKHIVNYFLGVTDTKDNADKTIKITPNQKKWLDKTADLKGKKITCYEYENDRGKFVGVKVIA